MDYVSMRVIEAFLRELEWIINRTPTGTMREHLCDVQILLRAALNTEKDHAQG